MAGPNDKASPPAGNPLGLGPEDVEKVRAMAREQNVEMVFMLLTSLAPKIPPAALESFVRGCITQQEHEDFARVLDDATDPKAREERPIWGVKLFLRGKGQDINAPALLTLRSPKDPSGIKTADEALQYVTILGLVTNPTTRALLLALGYEPHFFQMRSSPIVTL